MCLAKLFLNTSAVNPYKTTHASKTREAFPLKSWSPSDDGFHWPKHVEALFYY
jgi:hypothetical protein